MIERLLKVSEVAELMSCSIDQVYSLIYSGQMKAKNISATGNKASWRVPESSYKEFIK